MTNMDRQVTRIIESMSMLSQKTPEKASPPRQQVHESPKRTERVELTLE